MRKIQGFSVISWAVRNVPEILGVLLNQPIPVAPTAVIPAEAVAAADLIENLHNLYQKKDTSLCIGYMRQCRERCLISFYCLFLSRTFE